MDEKKTSQTEIMDRSDDSYELDMDENHSDNLAEVMEEAVAAVEGGSKGSANIPIEVVGPEDPETEAADPDHNSNQERLSRAEEENAQLRDRLARTMADFDNFRKRSEREKAAVRGYAVSEVVGDFLGVIDNLERAAAASGSVEDLKQGVEMILRLFADTLRRHHVERIKSVGQPFDPSLHEAVAKEENPEVEMPTVTVELQPGYTYKDRLLRPAMVNVAMPVARTSKPSDASDSE